MLSNLTRTKHDSGETLLSAHRTLDVLLAEKAKSAREDNGFADRVKKANGVSGKIQETNGIQI